jgi:Na+/proline symporter
MSLFTPLLTLGLVGSFALAMIAVSIHRQHDRGLGQFLVAGRSVPTLVGAASVASTWIWAPALFLAAQKAYQQGAAGLMWFTVPNVACLVLFAFLARRIRRLFPDGFTLPQYVAHRCDPRTHLVYLFSFLALQVCSLAVQLIAGASLLAAMGNVPYPAGVLLLAVTFTSYSLLDGLRTSIRTDLLQMLIIAAGLVVIVPPAITHGGGTTALVKGLAGASGTFGNPFDPWVAYSFGITVTIGLLSGPVGDQQHWQRAFAFRPGSEFRGYLAGAAIFAVVPLSLGMLGFLAAGNPAAAPAVAGGQLPAQQVGPEVIRTLLPPWSLAVFLVMLLAGLASTGDSALCAGGSLVAVDIYRRYLNPSAADDQVLSVSRWALVIMAAGAIGIALIPGVTILSLFLFYGTLRSATFVPTLWLLFGRRVPAGGIFWGVTAAALVGLPCYLAGQFTGSIHLKVAANLGIVLISYLIPLAASTAARRTQVRLPTRIGPQGLP